MMEGERYVAYTAMLPVRVEIEGRLHDLLTEEVVAWHPCEEDANDLRGLEFHDAAVLRVKLANGRVLTVNMAFTVERIDDMQCVFALDEEEEEEWEGEEWLDPRELLDKRSRARRKRPLTLAEVINRYLGLELVPEEPRS